MVKLSTVYSYDLNNRHDDKYKTKNVHNNVAKKLHYCLGNVGKLISDVFIRVSVSFYHMNLIVILIQCWILISEMCLTLYELLFLA